MKPKPYFYPVLSQSFYLLCLTTRRHRPHHPSSSKHLSCFIQVDIFEHFHITSRIFCPQIRRLSRDEEDELFRSFEGEELLMDDLRNGKVF